MLGVSRDSVEENAAFAEKYGYPYRLLSDSSGDLCRAYGACGEGDAFAQRISYVIEPTGQISLVLEDVGPTEHVDRVLEFLSAGTSAG